MKYKVASRYEEIVQEFNDSMERNEEGIMIKDP